MASFGRGIYPDLYCTEDIFLEYRWLIWRIPRAFLSWEYFCVCVREGICSHSASMNAASMVSSSSSASASAAAAGAVAAASAGVSEEAS